MTNARYLTIFGLLTLSPGAWAGVFTTPHYIEEKEWALGLEPELTFFGGGTPATPGATGTGIGFTTRFTYGINELSNASVLLGSGSGPRQFRFGAVYTFDFVPDLQDQPGIGLALQGLHLDRPEGDPSLATSTSETVGTFEATAIPSIRKSFRSSNMSIEPFFAIPVGWRIQSHDTSWITQAVFGALVQATPQLKYSMEFGLNVASSESYVSTGLTFFWSR